MTYIYRRIAFYIVTLWAALTLNFILPRLMPGSPYDFLVGKYRDQIRLNPHFLDSLKVELGASNEPLLTQYFNYLSDMAHGNFGISYSNFPTPVGTILASTLPWTIFLAGSATILTFLLGTLLGTIVAWRRGGFLDSLLPPVTMFFSAFPAFFMALLLLYIFGFTLGWFPLQHSYSGQTDVGFNRPFIWDVLQHALLPLAVLLLTGVGGWLLGMRNVMVNTLSEEYITMAEAKGLSDVRVMMWYAARNAILPSITGFAIALGYAIGGVILVETVFSYPGVGFALVTAAQAEDYPLVQALLMLIVVCVLAANLVMDLLYGRLDPRARST